MLHINFLFSCALWMVILFALLILAFYTCSCFRFFTNKAFMLISFFLNILNSFYINSSIFFLKIAFRNPYWTYVMNPNIMACWLIIWICCFIKIIIIKLLSLLFILVIILFSYFKRMSVLLFLFIIRTFFWIFIIARISLFP